jgi:hypothetical protein
VRYGSIVCPTHSRRVACAPDTSRYPSNVGYRQPGTTCPSPFPLPHRPSFCSMPLPLREIAMSVIYFCGACTDYVLSTLTAPPISPLPQLCHCRLLIERAMASRPRLATAHNRTETENRTRKNLTETEFQFLWFYG